VDFTADELVVAGPVHRSLNRMYSDEPYPPCQVSSYSLEEILAEKMRTILQRTEPRDMYDVWRLLGEHGHELNLDRTKTILDAKCQFKGITFSGLNDFLSKAKVEKYQAAWERRLGEQVKALPPVKTVVRETRQILRGLF
jgi:predicted nucleotidyltransferase component of viral defense system